LLLSNNSLVTTPSKVGGFTYKLLMNLLITNI
jgi:hypothetical protein